MLDHLTDRLHAAGCRCMQRGQIIRLDKREHTRGVQLVEGEVDRGLHALRAVALFPMGAAHNAAQTDTGFCLIQPLDQRASQRNQFTGFAVKPGEVAAAVLAVGAAYPRSSQLPLHR